MKKLAATAALLSLVAAFPLRAQLVTSSPGTDALLTTQAATLATQLGVSADTLATMGQIVTVGQQSLQTARMTSEVLRTAYDSVQSFQYITQGDVDFFDSAAQLFFQTFPEVSSAFRDASAIKNNLMYIKDGGSPGGFDPYRFLQLIADMQNAGESAYSTLHALDDLAYNLGDEHLAVVKHLDEAKRYIEKTVRETGMDIGQTDLRASALLANKIAARNADANTQAAIEQAELVRQGKLEYTRRRAGSVKAAATIIDQMNGFAGVLGGENGLDNTTDAVEMAPGDVEKFVPRGFD